MKRKICQLMAECRNSRVRIDISWIVKFCEALDAGDHSGAAQIIFLSMLCEAIDRHKLSRYT